MTPACFTLCNPWNDKQAGASPTAQSVQALGTTGRGGLEQTTFVPITGDPLSQEAVRSMGERVVSS